jgi:hypothetical protein
MRLFAPAILAGLVAAGTVLPIQADAATAACLTKPGAAAPQGSHWYYRMDRTANRKCWFLAESARATKSAAPMRLPSARSRSVALMSRVVAEGATAETTVGAGAPAAGVAEAMASESNKTMDFSMRWPTRSGPAAAIRPDPLPLTSNYADEQATAEAPDEETRADMPLVWPVLTAAAATEPLPQSATRPASTPALLAGALALVAIFGAAMTFSAARHPGRGVRRDRPLPAQAPEANASPASADVAPAVDKPADVACKPVPPVPPVAQVALVRRSVDRAPLKAVDPDHDVEDRLQQLLQDWRRVAA